MMDGLRVLKSLGTFIPDINGSNFLDGKTADLSAAEILRLDDARLDDQSAQVMGFVLGCHGWKGVGKMKHTQLIAEWLVFGQKAARGEVRVGYARSGKVEGD